MASSSFWKFRPSALASAISAYTSAYSRDELTELYEYDNQRAAREDVTILSRSESSKLRTLQWNINNGRHNFDKHSSFVIQKGLVDAIKDSDADVVVLNEYSRKIAYRWHQTFEEDLKAIGYSYVECATVDYPTAIATRLKVKQYKEIQLSYDRSALLAQVQTKNGTLVWVIGTHINFACGEQRMEEMQALVTELEKFFVLDDMRWCSKKNCATKIVLVGDLNQQRENDYAPEEWELIRSGMETRGSCQDDGVAQLLSDQGFVCAWDSKAPHPPKTNWETAHPPATHWSGTIVDYSYGRNVSPLNVSVGPDGWSDHRMTVCDWTW